MKEKKNVHIDEPLATQVADCLLCDTETRKREEGWPKAGIKDAYLVAGALIK